MTYLRRAVGDRILAALGAMPVVVITGMRQTGKSTLLASQPGLSGRRYVSLDDFAALESAASDPEGFVAGDDDLTIDEAQRRPELLLAIKRKVDHGRRPGMFLLSGSASLGLLKGVSETLAGRAVHFNLRPFTRLEADGRGADRPALITLMETGELPRNSPSRPVGDGEVLCGGLPPAVLARAQDRSLWFKGFEQTYLERDVRDLARLGDLGEFRRFLRLCALRTAGILNRSALARDGHVSDAKAREYLGILEASFVITLIPPFLGNKASRLVKSPKLYVADSGLAGHLAGVIDLHDEPLKGALLETWAAHNLLGILDAHRPGAGLHFWNVQGRQEVDFIIEDGRKTYAIEIKSASRWTSDDLKGLKSFAMATPGCAAAVLAHNGRETARLGDRLWAVPLGRLLS